MPAISSRSSVRGRLMLCVIYLIGECTSHQAFHSNCNSHSGIPRATPVRQPCAKRVFFNRSPTLCQPLNATSSIDLKIDFFGVILRLKVFDNWFSCPTNQYMCRQRLEISVQMICSSALNVSHSVDAFCIGVRYLDAKLH